MLELIYGFLVAAAGVAAYYSRTEAIQRTMLVLFVGWLVYIHTQQFADFAARVNFNIMLDAVLLSGVWLVRLSWREHRASQCCEWVVGTFIAMLLWHGAQLVFSFNLYTYYLVCNVLFTVQLGVIAVYSLREMQAVKQRKFEARQWQSSLKELHGSKVISIAAKKV